MPSLKDGCIKIKSIFLDRIHYWLGRIFGSRYRVWYYLGHDSRYLWGLYGFLKDPLPLSKGKCPIDDDDIAALDYWLTPPDKNKS